MAQEVRERIDLDLLEKMVKRLKVPVFVGRSVEGSLSIIAELRRRGFKYIEREGDQIIAGKE